ncbi:MAG: hypothetical protein QOE06_1330 [Thermoleophilaceae bacterium]|jgi:hypothetical protein|nr:hypothetical protein [Thermoleophilaceae bacterium]
MDHNERADELEKEADRLEHESEKLAESTDQARSDWEARKSAESSAPGAADPEGAGPHHIDAEDPATGRRYGERRQQEIEDAEAADSEEDGDNDST